MLSRQDTRYSPSPILEHFGAATLSGFIAWAAFILIGQTPIVRASGLALVIAGVTLSLQRMGFTLSIIGGLTLAFSPAFWLQTGGGDAGPATIVLAVAAAAIGALVTILTSKRPYISLGIGLVVFVVIFWSQVGTPRSLRLTSLVTAWLMYILVDMLIITNPRPDGEKPEPAYNYHIYGILLLFTIGVLNDPLLILFIPALVGALLVCNRKLAVWYWGILIGVSVFGGTQVLAVYINGPENWIALLAWRDANRWIDVVDFVIQQFSLIGVLLGALGIARLARWYAPLGIITMVAYAAYVFFGLIYMGPNLDVFLLPLLIIQTLWMTYAVYTINQWVMRTLRYETTPVRWITTGTYVLVPVTLFLRILSNAASG